ncbi:hypothetical protein MNQ98_10815 [Paenibacillus sp. N3/727]|uniref:hypothetical protein n=1 Tax=Paenibacillus sp. N3/727 TaxID=2925845 RepID=UPI001F537A19|nr:hypothetical protein [Paenibacillus sp. N3/727]UNK20465.1 hypothetical protein MNQ98_10815 [Paenibacillus sp. N3/727]
MEYAKISGNNVVITIPIDVLVITFVNSPDKYDDEIKVKYRKQFAKGFAELINEHLANSGLTAF